MNQAFKVIRTSRKHSPHPSQACLASEFQQLAMILLQSTVSWGLAPAWCMPDNSHRVIHKINLLACQHYPSSTWMCCVSGYRIRLTGCLKAGFVKPWLFSVSQTCHLPGSLLQHSLPTMLLRRWHHSCALLSAPVLVSPLWR